MPNIFRANLFSFFFLEKKHEDVLLSFLYLVCLFAVKITASEALWGQLHHLYKLLADHCVYIWSKLQVCDCRLRCLFLLRNDTFSRVEVVALKEINGEVPDRRN